MWICERHFTFTHAIHTKRKMLHASWTNTLPKRQNTDNNSKYKHTDRREEKNASGMQRIKDVKPHLIVGYYKYFPLCIHSVQKNIALCISNHSNRERLAWEEKRVLARAFTCMHVTRARLLYLNHLNVTRKRTRICHKNRDKGKEEWRIYTKKNVENNMRLKKLRNE